MTLTADKIARRKSNLQQVVREVFGHAGMRPFQASVTDNLMEGRDVFAVAPTSMGKSLTFQAAALVLPGTTVIVSPLLALMREQVDTLGRRGVEACRLTSDAPASYVANAMADLSKFQLVYVSPEKAKTVDFRAAIRDVEIGAFCVDEAHVAVSMYRSAYASLGAVFEDKPEAIRYACTATADDHTEHEIRRMLRLRNPVRVVGSPWRDNLTWEFADHPGEEALYELVRKHQRTDGSQIVYCASRNESERLSDLLSCGGLSAGYYHAGMEQRVRQTAQQNFMDGTIRCMVATSAFGMGVDKADIRLVANWQLPSTLFDLLQQSGRGGRDGEEAHAWVALGSSAEKSQRYFMRISNPPLKVYERLWASFAKYTRPMRWRRDALLRAAGIGDARWAGWLDSAMSYLEYTGHITTSPAGTVYNFPIKDVVKAARVARAIGAKLGNGCVLYEADPGRKDRSGELITSGACDWATPQDALVVRPVFPVLGLNEDILENKKARAEEQFDAIYDFARADDRKAFAESAFAKSSY
jgi:ATP-dependent DNA helicase RecQ